MTDEWTGNQVTFELKLRFEAGSIQLSVPVPDREMRVADFLPILNAFQDAIALGITKDAERRGSPVSCGVGCAACCRQPVPISESEAVRLAELVESLPDDHRARVRERFEATLEQLESHGLLDRLREVPAADRAARMRLGGEYTQLWLACPFLEDESCSIYAERPLRCREFLVTSPPANCASPDPGTIARPPSQPGPWPLIYRFEDGRGDDEPRWVALVLALEYAASRQANALPTFSAPEMFQNLLRKLSANPPPDAPMSPA